MTYRRDLFYEIVASADFQAAMVGPMIDDFVQKMKRPGADGATYRGFIEDWLYLQRPLFDQVRGVRYNVQFEGPPLIIDQREYPLARISSASSNGPSLTPSTPANCASACAAPSMGSWTIGSADDRCSTCHRLPRSLSRIVLRWTLRITQ